ncbi:hypothetical protein EDB19DRAFT_1917719 [Suillus lakei]|nr:hypothetical protein EDB19DRAFT_1917719 [Suillus lakei]
MTADTTTASKSLEPAVTSKKSMVAQMMSSARPVRSPQVTEAFSKLFFEDTIKPTLDLAFKTAKAEAEAKAAAENTKVKLPSKIAILKKQTNLLYHSASDEVKQQVVEFIEDTKKKKKKEWEEVRGTAVVDRQVYINRIPGTLNEFFNKLQRLTGLVFTVLMGGPTPAMGGQIEFQSFHVGATKVGNQFNQAYTEFDLSIMQPWKEFVNADGISLMLSVEGYHEFLRTYGAPQAIPTLQPPLSQHGPTLPSTSPTPKPLTSEVTTPANDAIAAQQGPSPSTQSSSMMTKDSPANSHLQPLSESNSTEAAPFKSMSTEAVPSATKFTSAEAAPSGEESTSAEAAPSTPEFTSAEAVPSGKVTASLVVSCSK